MTSGETVADLVPFINSAFTVALISTHNAKVNTSNLLLLELLNVGFQNYDKNKVMWRYSVKGINDALHSGPERC